MSKEALDERIDAIARALTQRVDLIVAEELRRMRTDAPEFFRSEDPDFVTAYTASCVAHFRLLVARLTSGRDVPAVPPPAAVEEARAVAQWGISLESLLQTYRTGHAVIWEHAMEVVDEVVTGPDGRREPMKLISRFLFDYTDAMMTALAEVYESERMAGFHDRNRRRRQLVRDVLEGLPIDQSKLPYLVSGVHLAAVSAGENADRTFAQLAASHGLSSLTVAGPSGSTWAWFGGNALTDPDVARRLAGGVPKSLVVGLGDVAEGVDGFRVSHVEATQAYRIARRSSMNVARYTDVALTSLALMDEPLARQFMTRQLGFLADVDDPRASELRTTLRAYFDAGHNASVAAARLNLNDRTVAYRLRTVEQKLDGPIVARRDELSVALRLFEVFEG
ncbi:helix-turn-helix domain-containing protein [Nocardioides sambongensis]|uniref:helix-turn-helix domain-containing protein n=1 Tax=Nocardioides sambongensis TaxID=2589074 RepID=UPI001125D6A9|nr:helix-turn-helix domain-containing protein [Nocardioides sambongensis]